MSEFVAGAFIDVLPDAKNFRSQLKRDLNAAVQSQGPIKIPVELDPRRLKSTINAAAKQSPAKIPIETKTSVTALRNEIKSKIDAATKGLKIKVPIEVVDTTPAARTASAGGAGGGASSATNAAAAAKGSAAKASKQLSDAEKLELSVNKALKKSQDELALSGRLFAQATEQSLTPEERKIRLQEARQASTRAITAVNKELAISEAQLTAAQRASLEAALAEAQAARVHTVKTAEDVAVTAAQSKVRTQSAKASEAAAAAMTHEIKAITTLSELHVVENELTSAEAALKRNAAKARELGLADLAAENELLAQQIVERKQLIVLQRAEIKGDTARSRSQKTTARGFASTLLSLLGIRGATLAASTAFLGGAVAAALFAKSIKSFADLETELNTFQATTGATNEQMQEVAATARELGADISLPGVSAADAAQAMSALARAGLSVRDSIAGTRGVLELAAAAQISNADAADLTASALNAFGLAGDQAVHVADLLANAANASQGSISEMAAALAQASAIARQVGFSLDDTVAILTQFARNGLRGSDAGTSLRTALSRLIAPTKKASDLMAELGLNARDASGNLRPDIFVQFGEATKNLSPALRDMIAETIAGQDAIRAFAIGAREGRQGLRLAQLQMEATGTAAQLAAARSKGLGGEFRALGSNAETLGTQFGQFASGPVKTVVKGFNDIATALNQIFTGDFGGLFSDFEHDSKQALANTKQRAVALVKILNPLETDRFGQLGKLFGNAPDVDREQQRVEALLESLSRLQNLRVSTAQVGGPIGPITEKIKDLRRQLKEAKVDAGLIIPVTPLEKALAPLEEAKKQAQDLKQEIIDTAHGPTDTRFLDQLIQNFNTRMKLVRQNAKTAVNQAKQAVSGNDIAQSFIAQFKLIGDAPELATPDVISGLNDLAAKIKGHAPLTGAAGREVGKKIIDGLNEAIRAAVEADNPDAAAQLQALATKLATLFGDSLAEAFKNVKVPLTEEQILDKLLPQRIKSARAEAFGSVNDQIEAKEAELKALKANLGKVIKGSADEEKLLNDISAKQGEIEGLRQQQAQDAKERTQKADKAVTDAISEREQGFLNRLTEAQDTKSLKDDIKRQTELRNFYRAEIATVKATVKDAETRKDQVDALEQKLFEAERDLAKDRRDRRGQIRDVRLQKIDDAADRASETETLKDDLKQARRRVRFWERQVAVLKDLVKQRKATGDEVKEAQDNLDAANDNLRQTIKSRKEQIVEDTRQGFELDIEFAQTTGNENAEVKARNRFIRFLEKQIKAVKGNILKVKELRNEIAAQKKAINDIKGDTEKDKGTTVFELLTEAAQTFRDNGGNLINGNQPFAGPAGFTADLSQFLFRNAAKTGAAAKTVFNPPTRGGNRPTGLSELSLEGTRSLNAVGEAADSASEKVKNLFGGPRAEGLTAPAVDLGGVSPLSMTNSVDRQTESTDRLTTSINRLINTLERQPGTGKTQTKKALPAGIQRTERNHFAVATAARRVVEERTSI